MNYIKIPELVEGEFYQSKNIYGPYIFRCGKSDTNIRSHRLCYSQGSTEMNSFDNTYDNFGGTGLIVDNIELATPENREKLEACIKAGGYIKINEIIYEIY